MSQDSHKQTSGQRTLFHIPPGVIDLGIGAPDSTLLDLSRKAIQTAANSCFDPTSAVSWLQYGPVAGDIVFRRHLAEFISQRSNATPVNPEDLFVTSGATSGLAAVVSRFFCPGAPAIVESPTYFLARDVLKEAGLQLIEVDQDQGGLNMDGLATALETLPKVTDGFAGLVYCVPTHNNPTGSTLNSTRRKRLVELASIHNVLVVCDDVYELLDFDVDTNHRARVVDYDHGDGNVISNCSFSKILGPGVRCGWMEMRPSLHQKLATSGFGRSGGGMAHAMTGPLTTLLASGGQGVVLDAIRTQLAKRCRTLVNTLSECVPKWVDVYQPTGGYFVWMNLNGRIHGDDLLHIATRDHGVSFQPGSRFGQKTDCLRVSFAHYPPNVLQLGATALGACLHQVT